MSKKTIAVDLDGTLASYDKWWGVKHFGKPIQGAKEFLQALRDKGYRILIYTARTAGRNKGKADESGKTKYTQEDLVQLVADWLDKYELPYDAIHYGDSKPAASAFVDDRAVECRPQDLDKPERAYNLALLNIERIANGNKNHGI